MTGPDDLRGRTVAVLFGIGLTCITACSPSAESEALMTEDLTPDGMPGMAAEPPGPTEATDTLLTAARSDDVENLQALSAKLSDFQFLSTLNSELEYQALEPVSLQLYLVLAALAANESAAAAEAFSKLAEQPPYQYAGPFAAAYLEASRHEQDPGPELLAYWGSQLDSEGSELFRTVDVLVGNGSPPALSRLADALVNENYREDYIVAWIRDPILRNRQNQGVVDLCAILIRSSWPDDLKAVLVSALFEYQPDAWYAIDVPPPQPPARSALQPEVRTALEALIEDARSRRLISRRQRDGFLEDLNRSPS